MQVDILNLLNFKISHIDENEHDFQIKVETNSPPSHCPHCGCVASLYKHDKVIDLPIHRKRVGLIVKRQRYRCRDCKHTFWER
nr:transposase family protein [Paenibacillus ferrarius]